MCWDLADKYLPVEFIEEVSDLMSARCKSQGGFTWGQMVEDVKATNLNVTNWMNVRSVLQMALNIGKLERVPLSETTTEEYRIPKDVY